MMAIAALWRLPGLLWLLMTFSDGFMPPSVRLSHRTRPLFRSEQPFRATATCLHMAGIPLTDLLQQLDEQGIRYPPSASRADLEKLLNHELIAENVEALGISSDTNQSSSSGKSSAAVEVEADSGSNEQLPLTLILVQLDIRNVRYEPSATRLELEGLLKKYEEEEALDKEGRVANVPLKELLAQLDERQIRYPPSASRRELSRLLSEDNGGTVAQRQSPPSTSRRLARKEKTQLAMPLRQLLAKLDERNIQYPPSASRQELESLLLGSRDVSNPKRRSRSSRGQQETPRSAPPRDSPEKKVPIRIILEELDKRQIRYPPGATRSELEDLLKESNVRLRKRRQRQERGFQDKIADLPLPARQTIESLRPGFSDLARKAAREAKYMSRNVREYLAEDEDGVREPQWSKEEAVREPKPSKDQPIDVEAVPIRRKRAPPSPRPQRPKASATRPPSRPQRPKASTAGPPPRPQRSKASTASPPPRPQRPKASTAVTPPPQPRRSVKTEPDIPLRPTKGGKMTRSAVHQLPLSNTTSSADSENGKSSSGRKQERKPSSSRRRKVYSPYGPDKIDADSLDPFDAIDRFGEAIADAAESVIWGPIDEEDEENPPASKQRPQNKKGSRARYWRDRMEEQVDLFMGTHDEDSNYTNWEYQVGDSRKRPARSKSKKRKKSAKKPIWEEEGSLVSLLFGRRPSGGQLKLERFFENNEIGTNILTNFVSSLLKGGLLVLSYLCRWASVRGAIPQPVVVMAVASTAVSARPGKRFNMVLISLLVLRTLGELIHGYVRGDQDWEDGNKYEFAKEGPASEELEDDEDWENDKL